MLRCWYSVYVCIYFCLAERGRWCRRTLPSSCPFAEWCVFQTYGAVFSVSVGRRTKHCWLLRFSMSSKCCQAIQSRHYWRFDFLPWSWTDVGRDVCIACVLLVMSLHKQALRTFIDLIFFFFLRSRQSVQIESRSWRVHRVLYWSY